MNDARFRELLEAFWDDANSFDADSKGALHEDDCRELLDAFAANPELLARFVAELRMANQLAAAQAVKDESLADMVIGSLRMASAPPDFAVSVRDKLEANAACESTVQPTTQKPVYLAARSTLASRMPTVFLTGLTAVLLLTVSVWFTRLDLPTPVTPTPSVATTPHASTLSGATVAKIKSPPPMPRPVDPNPTVFLGAISTTLSTKPKPSGIATLPWRITPSQGAKFELTGPFSVRLTRGQLLLELTQVSGDIPTVVVETPQGKVEANSTRFFVESAPQLASGLGRPKPTSSVVPTTTRVLVVSGAAKISNSQGESNAGPGELVVASQGAQPAKTVNNLHGSFGELYKPVTHTVAPVLASATSPTKTALSIEPRKVSNWNYVVSALQIGEAAQSLLKKNGFVIVPQPRKWSNRPDEITSPYTKLIGTNVPTLLTSDTLLHLVRVQLDESLREIEQQQFHADFVALLQMLLRDLQQQYETHRGSDLELQALHHAWRYAAIGYRELEPEWKPPTAIAAAITKPGSLTYSAPSITYRSTMHSGVNFSSHVARHYQYSPELQRYAQSMAWFGKVDLPFQSGFLSGITPTTGTNQPNPKLRALAAGQLAKLLANGKLADGRSAKDVWQRIYSVTSFYLGFADDLGLSEYEAAIKHVVGPEMNLARLNDDDVWKSLQSELAKYRAPAIYNGTGWEQNSDPSGSLLMGRRFASDAYLLSKLVHPHVGQWKHDPAKTSLPFTAAQTKHGVIRGLPRGLDLMHALGSKRAGHWIAALGDDAFGTERDTYAQQVSKFQQQFARTSPREFNRNLHWSWMYGLQGLLDNTDDRYPNFMANSAWQDKSLNTALASWSHLCRHAAPATETPQTLVASSAFAQPVASSSLPKPKQNSTAFVEPSLLIYARMLATTRMANAGLTKLGVKSSAAKERLARLESLLTKLLEIANKQLSGERLDEVEREFVVNLPFALSHQQDAVARNKMLTAYFAAVKNDDHDRAKQFRRELEGASVPTTLVAENFVDVHTGNVLQTATGNVELVVVCFPDRAGKLTLAAGPVLSYYEFKHPAGQQGRLSDQQWRTRLLGQNAPSLPEWTHTYRSTK